MKLCHIMHADPENFPFSQLVHHKRQIFNIWQQTKSRSAQIAEISKLQEQLSIFNNFFLKKFISNVENVYHQPKHMHSIDTAKVCGKSSRICCSALFSSRMVFGFKFVKCLQHFTLHINTQVVKIWRIWWPFILYNEVRTVGL